MRFHPSLATLLSAAIVTSVVIACDSTLDCLPDDAECVCREEPGGCRYGSVHVTWTWSGEPAAARCPPGVIADVATPWPPRPLVECSVGEGRVEGVLAGRQHVHVSIRDGSDPVRSSILAAGGVDVDVPADGVAHAAVDLN